jgi:protein required for attachment to host cells
MSRQSRRLIVIADGDHVRFVRPAEDDALHNETVLPSAAVHKRSADLGSDRPGASVHSGSTAHNAMAPRHDPHGLAKKVFARSIAERLNVASGDDGFDEPVLVAPPHTLQAIRSARDTPTGAKVAGSLQKDLVKVTDDALWPHVQAWVQPVHRAWTPA